MAKDYDVGYGKPPKDHQWPKGKSGNPAGRPKGSRGLKTDLNRELDAQLTIAINGEPVKGTTQQLMLRTLARRAAHGDVRAIKLLTDLVLQVFGAGDRGTAQDRLSPQEEAMMEEMMKIFSPDELGGGDVEGAGNASGGKTPTKRRSKRTKLKGQ